MNKVKLTPWDKAIKVTLERLNSYPNPELDKLDKGVNYFILKLESMGLKTYWSCEGHPNYFYILFKATLEEAYKIQQLGYFRVELENNCLWAIRLRQVSSERDKRQTLRWASEAWEKKLK